MKPWNSEIRDQAGQRVLFSVAELACRGSGMLALDPLFAKLLLELRQAFGRPMVVTSCCRSAAHNRAVGGHPRSLHVCDDDRFHKALAGAAAIDIACPDGGYARALVYLALSRAWSVGIRQTGAGQMVHLDRRDLAGLAPAAFGY